jgi:hypothetical protein
MTSKTVLKAFLHFIGISVGLGLLFAIVFGLCAAAGAYPGEKALLSLVGSWGVGGIGAASAFVPVLFARGRVLPEQELTDLRPGWLRWGFVIPWLLWVALLPSLFSVVITTGSAPTHTVDVLSCIIGVGLASLTALRGLLTVITGVHVEVYRKYRKTGPRTYERAGSTDFCYGNNVRLIGALQVLLGSGVVCLAAFLWRGGH